jgi:hypothetical protein
MEHLSKPSTPAANQPKTVTEVKAGIMSRMRTNESTVEKRDSIGRTTGTCTYSYVPAVSTVRRHLYCLDQYDSYIQVKD